MIRRFDIEDYFDYITIGRNDAIDIANDIAHNQHHHAWVFRTGARKFGIISSEYPPEDIWRAYTMIYEVDDDALTC